MERDKQTILESIMLHMILFHLQIYICLQENDCFISILTYNVWKLGVCESWSGGPSNEIATIYLRTLGKAFVL